PPRAGDLPGCAGPADGKPVEYVAEGVHRGLDEVVSDGLRGLRLGRSDKRAGDLRRMGGLVERYGLRLGVEHRLGELWLESHATAEARIRPAVLRVYRLRRQVVDRHVMSRPRKLRPRQDHGDGNVAGLAPGRPAEDLQPIVAGGRCPPR